jgi:hypothetical protein
MTAFIFALSGSLLVCSLVLHVEGSREAVELNASAPPLEDPAHIESSGQSEAAALLRAYSQDSATVAATYSSRLKAAQAAEAAKQRAYLSKRGATAGGSAGLNAKAAERLAAIEEERGAKFERLLETKAANLERVKSRQFSAADEIGGRNKKRLQTSEERVNKYSSYLSTFSVLTVVFFLLTIVLDEIHKRGSGIQEIAIPHQYQFEEPVLSKLSKALSGKFQYHARRVIDRIEDSTPAPGAPLTPHPLYDWSGLTPRRVTMQTRERKQPPYMNGKHNGSGGDDGGGVFVATKQTPGGGGSANRPTTTPENGGGERLAEEILGSAMFSKNSAARVANSTENSAGGDANTRETFYFVDKDKAAFSI